MPRSTQLIVSALSITVLCPVLSRAQGFYWNTASARSMAIGGIYVPSSTGPLDALAANPAGLTNLAGPTADLSVTAEFARGSFSNSVNSNAPLDTPPGAVPYGAFGMPIGKSRFSFAVGETPELMSVANWHYVDAPGVAGATYGMQQDKSAILAARSVAGVGIYLGPRLSIGASFGADYNTNTLDAPYIFQSQPVVKGLKTLLDLNTSGYGWNGSVGALVRPSRDVQISVAWKSSTVINSTGSAFGNLAQQAAALGIPARPDFNYSAAVRNVLPQSVIAGATWRVNPRWMFALQGDWIGWNTAFKTLPVALTNGNNASINGLVNSTSLYDNIPLQWKDQYAVHAGFERMLTESVSFSAGFAHANNPVPSSTLSPLTAAILANQISTGIGYVRGRTRFDAAYAFDPTARESVGQSALLSGEYSNSTVRVGIQAVTVSTSFRF
jgi:long-subunit fatty acid transport protein